jgi:hypothetical protein
VPPSETGSHGWSYSEGVPVARYAPERVAVNDLAPRERGVSEVSTSG